MKILVISSWGGGLALAWRLRKEGHQVRMFIKPHEGEQSNVGDGFIEKVKSWEPSKDWADFILFDDGGFGEMAEGFKKEGKTVWGGSKWSDEIELDRGKGQEAFKSSGMKVISSHEFSSLPEALAFVKKNPGRYVVKPSGEIQDEKALTYVGKEDNGLDMISMLEQYQSKWSAKIKKLELQEFKKGIEVAIGGFFNGKDFLDPILINFEHKKLMCGNVGPASGEMGTAGAWMGKRKIYKETLGKMVQTLSEHRYVGYFDINCIVEGNNLWPLEVTSRFGYPTIQMKLETMERNLGDLMFQTAQGKVSKFKVSNPYSVCFVVATPPFPFLNEELYEKYSEDQKILFRQKDRTGIQPGEVYRDENNDWKIGGNSGFTLVCSGQGKNLKTAKEMAFKRVESLIVPNCMYRIDISDESEANLKALARKGWFV